jgi:hypothetical protein
VAAPKVDERKLEALAQAAAPAAAPETAPEKPADLSKAEEKLSSLLGNKK